MLNRVIRRPEVETLTGIPRSTLYAKIAMGDFPAPIKIGERAVGWLEAEVHAWLESRQRSNPKLGGFDA
jgi:prophage regulatory protein